MHRELLLGKTLPELQAVCAECGLPAFAALQMARWLYLRRVQSIAEMTDISLQCRRALENRYDIGRAAPVDVQVSGDGTRKYLFALEGGANIETVYIPDGERATLCVSSQAGCRMGCRFCMTAQMGFVRHLSAADIVNQILSVPESAGLTNIVFMGMGEPLDNYGAVSRALGVITAEWGMGWSPQRVTLSTIGIGGGLEEFLEHSRCHLAVSVHSPFGSERQALMPMQKAHPLGSALALIRRCNWRGQRRVSFEYILFDKINDTPRHAAALAELVRGLECRINLIRFHPIPRSSLRPSTSEAVQTFLQCLRRRGIVTTLRASRGEDIMAACGMLATRSG